MLFMPDSSVAPHAGDKIAELVAWLEKGEITAEEELLEALAAAPLPRKGANTASKSAPGAGALMPPRKAGHRDWCVQACAGVLHRDVSFLCGAFQECKAATTAVKPAHAAEPGPQLRLITEHSPNGPSIFKQEQQN